MSSESLDRAGLGELNRVELDATGRRLKALIASELDAIHELEALLSRIGRVLRISQPPANGKVDLRWWIEGGRSPYRTPVLVKWVMTRVRRYRVVEPARIDVRTDGNFALNAEPTRQLVALARELIRERDSHIHQLRMMQTNLSRTSQRLGRLLATARGSLEIAHTQVVSNLERAGYFVEGDLYPDAWGEEPEEE